MKKMGVMLDCSRNAVMHVDGIKRFVDVISLMGYNVLMLYTEDTYEVDNEPLFGYLRGRYSKNEIIEIDNYCSNKGVELIPCIQTLAHLSQIFQWDPYKHICDCNDILLVGEDRTYELIDNMFKTMRACVKSNYIHIGMDEAWMLGSGNYKTKHGKQLRSQILIEHLNRVCQIAEKYSFTPMMWSDMFFSNAAYDEYNKELLQQLPSNIQLVDWEYGQVSLETHKERFEKHLSLERPIWFASGAWKWIGFSAPVPDTEKALNTSLRACIDKGIENTLITLWGDDGNETPAYAVLTNIFFQAEFLRGNTDEKSISEKFEKEFGENWNDFKLFHLTFKDKSLKKSLSSQGAKSMFYNDPFLGKFDSTVVGGGKEAHEWAEKANEFKLASKRSANYSYIFDSYARLCEFLEIKHELGYKTRMAYKTNKRKLADIVVEYDEAIIRLEKFIDAFRNMWFKDNKPHGFDVQEIRLGGLMMRLKSCRNRIQLLLDDKIDKIEELEENIVNVYDGSNNCEKGVIGSNNYKEIATVNRL